MDYINTRFSFDEKGQDNAKIKVIGVGGGGGNAINNMIRKGLDSVEYIALNTDAQALKNNEADLTIQVGSNLTSGLGAGARPEIGREAVEENRHELDEVIDSADMIFITAGMGGGTGTGGAPVVAGIAKRKGILTVGIVTTPFIVEGKVRMKYALDGITELKKNCDTVIVIPNERLLDIADDNTSLMEAFEQANEVLYNATRGISDLILMPGLINLDFADVRTTMIDGGAAIMGSATATGPDRAEIAAREAINSPLLDGVSIRGARNVLVNISAGPNLGMRETTTAASIIQQEAGDEAEIILGTVLDESFEDELRVTVIATGFELSQDRTQAKVAPNKTTESMSKPKSAGLPKASDIARRHSNTLDGPFYKGEKNLKNLDSPAIHRRDLKYIRHTEEAVEADDDFSESIQQERKKASNDDTLLNDRSERIDKRDSEQPAFLRKIMD
jgi:cell division protein FtsZ